MGVCRGECDVGMCRGSVMWVCVCRGSMVWMCLEEV